MKKLSNVFFLFWLMILPSAFPQKAGVAEGRVVNLTDRSIVPSHVEIEVLELGGGMSIVRTAVSDATGRFRIADLPQDGRLIVRATYKGANYHADLTFNGGKAQAEIGVYEPTTSMKDIEVEGVQMAFQVMGDQLKTLETITFNNKTNPPRTFVNPAGSFRVSKPDGIIEPPKMRVTAPGSSMPLVQPALESADSKSYYSLYPLRPGITKFEVQQLLPYTNKRYAYSKRFYQDVSSVDLGVIPADVAVSGKGLSKIQADQQKNFAVYSSTPVKSGEEVVWEFSGGTPVPESTGETEAEAEVTTIPTEVARHALVIGPLLLMGFVSVLWYAFNRSQDNGSRTEVRLRHLKARREQLVNSIAELEHRYEKRELEEPEYRKKREEYSQLLRKISLLSKQH